MRSAKRLQTPLNSTFVENIWHEGITIQPLNCLVTTLTGSSSRRGYILLFGSEKGCLLDLRKDCVLHVLMANTQERVPLNDCIALRHPCFSNILGNLKPIPCIQKSTVLNIASDSTNMPSVFKSQSMISYVNSKHVKA